MKTITILRTIPRLLAILCIGMLPALVSAQCATYYVDSDRDGHGTGIGTEYCGVDPGTGFSTYNDDCDDINPHISPAKSELCNGVDDNCDGNIDEGLEVIAKFNYTGVNYFCAGDPILLTAVAGDGYNYQWYRNGDLIPGANLIFYVPVTSGVYAVAVNKIGGCKALSESASIIIKAKPLAEIGASGVLDLCVTHKVKLKANAGILITYQWYKDGEPVTGATEQFYTTLEPGSFMVKITNAAGCFAYSNVQTVYNSCREAGTENDLPESFTLSPNPSKGEFTIALDAKNSINENTVITIFDLTGKVVYEQPATVSNGNLNTTVSLPSGSANGMYIVKVSTSTSDFTSRIILQK